MITTRGIVVELVLLLAMFLGTCFFLPADAGAEVKVSTHVVGCQGSSAGFVLDGRADPALRPIVINQNDAVLRFSWKSDGKKHWLRSEVKTADGKLQLLGNPIYINYPNREPEPKATSSVLR